MLFRAGSRLANAGSFLSIILLAAACGTQLEIQAFGEDEDAAIQAAEVFFQTDEELSVENTIPAEAQPEAPRKTS